MRLVELCVILLNQEIGHRGVKVEAGDRADSGVGVVRRHHDVLRLGDGSDLLQFGDSTGVAHVGLEDVNRLVLH